MELLPETGLLVLLLLNLEKRREVPNIEVDGSWDGSLLGAVIVAAEARFDVQARDDAFAGSLEAVVG